MFKSRSVLEMLNRFFQIECLPTQGKCWWFLQLMEGLPELANSTVY